MLITNILASFPVKLLFSFISSLTISIGGFRKNSLSISGAIAAVTVGFTLTLASYCFFSSLLAFFISSSYWTKWKSDRKKKIESNFKEGAQDNKIFLILFVFHNHLSLIALTSVVCNKVLACRLFLIFIRLGGIH